MWVSVVLGFDSDGQLVVKWREAFQRHGELVGEWSHGEEHVKELRRYALVSRLRVDGVDVLPPLVDAVVRVGLANNINVSGISRHNPLSGKWTPAAWRMEVVSIKRPTRSIGVPVSVAPANQEHETSGFHTRSRLAGLARLVNLSNQLYPGIISA